MLIHVQVIGWENIELISDRPLEVMLEEFKRLKKEYPDRCMLVHRSSYKTCKDLPRLKRANAEHMPS